MNISLDENEILELAQKSDKCSKYLKNKEIKKTIYIKNKLMNILI